MKHFSEYVYKKVTVVCIDGAKISGEVSGCESCLEEDTEDPGYDSIDVYDGAHDIHIFRHEIADIVESEE